MNFVSRVERFGEPLLGGLRHFSLPVRSRFLNDGEYQPDSAVEQLPLQRFGFVSIFKRAGVLPPVR